MSSPTTIFLTGATGYIGGSILNRFLERPDAASFKITALVRSPEKAVKLQALGVNAVVGSHGQLDLVEELASQSEYAITTADVDDLPAAEATLKGLKKRYEATGKVPYYIHTSGTGVLADNAEGEYAGDVVYDDSNADQIASLAPTQVHRPVDIAVTKADTDGYVKTYIILPSTIYGIAGGKLVEEGIQNPHSIQVPAIIRASAARGAGGTVGKGVNLWPNVDIDELTDLYHILFDAIRANPEAAPHGKEGYYFGASGEHSLYDVGKAIGQALVDAGKATSAEPTIFNDDEIKEFFQGSRYLGSNSRCVANRSKSLGWNPKKSTADLLASISAEVKALVK
ncbi:NAD-binding protein [Pluteus cervinus]|uniref:NAD-binding protein n=1 Tax=Pluteus cervinus TaxID=181527 RepID=A0ACD3B4Y8_9AGAR|nr:NAD-binding protein [Pluteus cervinus]